MQALIEYAAYMPHGFCLFWQPWLVALYAGSDLLIFAAYSAIPVALLMFLRQRPDLRYRGLVGLFAAFIMLCGLTHAISVLTLWVPVYPLHGAVKLITGIVSAATAVVLFRLVPHLVALPSPMQLQSANRRLHAEIEAHEQTLSQLRLAQQDLEQRVEARTAELNEANEKLALATGEAVHRSRNLLSVVGSIARQTGRRADDITQFLEVFGGRLSALSNATASVLSDTSQSSADCEAVLRAQLEPVLMTYGDRISIEGPPVALGAEVAQQVSLVVHELATNAVKYGALATEEGCVRVAWKMREAEGGGVPGLDFTWAEDASLPAEDADGETPGFGTRLLLELVPTMLEGSAERESLARGMIYRLSLPGHALGVERPTSGQPAAERAPSIFGPSLGSA